MTVPLNSSYYSPPDIVINGKQQPQPQVFEQHTDQPGPSSSTPAPAHPQLGYNEPPTNTSPIPTPTTTSTSTTQPQPQAHSITIQARDGQLPQIYVMSKPEPAPVAAPPAVAAPLPLPPPPPPPPAAHRRPHPLLWVTLAISVLALVLGVPKGSIPTFTGRHRALRAQELLVQERLTLLSQLSSFLPPPLAALLSPTNANGARSIDVDLELIRLGTGLQLWNAGDAHGRWWTLEELGDGAAVVRSAGHVGSGSSDGAGTVGDKEVWVLREGDDKNPLLSALTASLMARERVAGDLDRCRASIVPCVCPAAPLTVAASTVTGKAGDADDDVKSDWKAWEKERQRREEAAEDRRRILREREAEVEERERDVARREAWVVDAMRKLSDRTRAQVGEMTLEDLITERLKAYQRELAQREAV